MISKTFFRWSAICVLLGAIILGTGYLLRANIDKQYLYELAGDKGFISSIMVAVGSLLFLAGLPGLFAAQNLYSSKGGIAASGFSYAGIAAFHLGTLALYFVLPVLVNHSSATYELIYSDAPPFPRFALFWVLSLLMQITGLLWMAIQNLKHSSYPKLNSVLLAAGALVFLIAPFLYFPLIKPANTLVMLGFALNAVHLLRRTRKEELLFNLKASLSV